MGQNYPYLQCGRPISHDEIGLIIEIVSMFSRLSITELANTVCEQLEWFSASGNPKKDACLKLLKKLESEKILKLPVTRVCEQKTRNYKGLEITNRSDSQPEIVSRLRDLNDLRLEIVNDAPDTQLFNEYIARYHYLGYKNPFGCHLRYFIKSNSGVLGCVMFAGATKAIASRDHWIGWDKNQRLLNLGGIVNNARFLIFPWVRIRFLASHILAKITKRISDDWYNAWNYIPVLMETFVDPKYEGCCYKAAGWKYLGMTTGRGLVRNGKEKSIT
jgi:hypothetical protein